ncbi:MAG TPA: DUF6427 family protein [Flavobacteriaceae bacterium]|nr:DUF6427 family protein [Flavobacteriaceae bacterium]
MLSNFLSKSRPINYLIILMILVIFFFIGVFSDANLKINLFLFGKILMNITALFFMVLLINFVIRKNTLTKDNSYSLFLVVIFFAMLPNTMKWSTVFLSNVFLLISLRRIFSLKNNVRTAIKIFDAGFWLGISILFYSNLILFWIVLLMGLVFYQRLNIKNFTISILGMFIPVFLFYVYCLTFNQLPIFNNIFNFQMENDIVFYGKLTILIPITILSSLTIWSIISITSGIHKISTKNKSSWFLVLTTLWIAILISYYKVDKNGSELIFLFFPASVIMANYFQKEKDKIFRNLILYLIFFVTIAVYLL